MILYGASGHAKVIIDILKLNGQSVSKIVDDAAPYHLLGIPVLKPDFEALQTANEKIIISIGRNSTRKKISEILSPAHFGIAIHPTAILDQTVKIQEGSVVMANATINSSVKIGKHCIVNTSANIDHDCFLEDYVHISPNATLSGNVRVGEGTHVGSGAVIIPGITIGKWATIGAGAVIIRDVPDGATVVGNPGKVIKINPEFQ